MNTANTGNTVNGLWQPVCHALWNFDSTGLCVLLAGKALCAMHRVGAKNVGLVGLVGRLALGAVCAMRFGNSKAHGSHGVTQAGLLAGSGTQPCAPEIPRHMALTAPCAMSVSVRIRPYSSVFPCPHPVPCAKCPASHFPPVPFLTKSPFAVYYPYIAKYLLQRHYCEKIGTSF